MPEDIKAQSSLKARPKRCVKEDWAELTHAQKRSLLIRTCSMLGLMFVYIVFCFCYLLNDQKVTKQNYFNDSISPSQQKLIASLSSKDPTSANYSAGAFYVEVTSGIEIESISAISPSNSSFTEQFNVWFDFNVREFKNMVYKKVYGDEADIRTDSDNTHLDSSLCYTDAYHPSIDYKSFLPASNMDWNMNGSASISGAYPKTLVADQAYDPQTSSYPKFEAPDENTRFFQERNIIATIHNDFVSPRYPLESVEFVAYITPGMDIKYMRLIPSDKSHLSSILTLDSGFSPIHDESEQFKSWIYYYAQDSYRPYLNYDQFITSELKFTLRANRDSGWNLFMQAFLTLFAVMIWCFIAYFSLTYDKEDVTSTLGAGIFSAVSSILIGVSLLSDAAAFSLVNMINIFALVTILVMFFIAMSAKKVYQDKNEQTMVFYDAYLKITCYGFLFLVLACFIALPLACFIFGL